MYPQKVSKDLEIMDDATRPPPPATEEEPEAVKEEASLPSRFACLSFRPKYLRAQPCTRAARGLRVITNVLLV